MSEQKQVEKEKNEEEIKPTKENVSDEYLKGYRVGYNRAVKRFKRNKLEIEVKKDIPVMKKEVKTDEPKDKIKNDEPKDNRMLWLIVVVVLGLVVFIYVVRRTNREPTQ